MDIQLNTNIEEQGGDIISGLNANNPRDVINYIESFFETYDALNEIEITIKAK